MPRRWLQLDLFRDWIPPPPPAPPPAPPRAVRPSREHDAERAMLAFLHVKPDPVRVYRQSISNGFESCVGRWWWCSRSEISRLVSQGRAITLGTRSDRARRSLTVAQEDAVVAAVHELGGLRYAAEAYGLGESTVRSILRDRGAAYPKASTRASDVATARAKLAQFKAARRAA